MFEETREYLKKIGMPQGDCIRYAQLDAALPGWRGLPHREPDREHGRSRGSPAGNGRQRTASSSTASPRPTACSVIRAAEIKEYCRVCHDYGAELLMSTGPRATYDTGATVLSPQGARIGYRLRGMEQVLRGVEDIKRGYDLGVPRFPYLR